MKQWMIRVGQREFKMQAEAIKQVGDYVTLFAKHEVVGLLHLGDGDSIVEVTTQ